MMDFNPVISHELCRTVQNIYQAAKKERPSDIIDLDGFYEISLNGTASEGNTEVLVHVPSDLNNTENEPLAIRLIETYGSTAMIDLVELVNNGRVLRRQWIVDGTTESMHLDRLPYIQVEVTKTDINNLGARILSLL